jgi:hypothetical protein
MDGKNDPSSDSRLNYVRKYGESENAIKLRIGLRTAPLNDLSHRDNVVLSSVPSLRPHHSSSGSTSGFETPNWSAKASTPTSPIDGTHRMAVLSALQLIPEANFAAKKLAKPANEQNVWMGKHKDGELPIAQ